eukprot:13077864-Heterocapsa_arctica.AAC.1
MGLSSSVVVQSYKRSARNIMVIAIVVVFCCVERITRTAVRRVSRPWKKNTRRLIRLKRPLMVIARMPED